MSIWQIPISVLAALSFDVILRFQMQLTYSIVASGHVRRYRLGPWPKVALAAAYLLPANVAVALHAPTPDIWAIAFFVIFPIYAVYAALVAVQDGKQASAA